MSENEEKIKILEKLLIERLDQMQSHHDNSFHKQGEIILDSMVRVAALEKILLQKNIITNSEIEEICSQVRDELLELIKNQLSKGTV